jgi:hypothetical protein
MAGKSELAINYTEFSCAGLQKANAWSETWLQSRAKSGVFREVSMAVRIKFQKDEETNKESWLYRSLCPPRAIVTGMRL